MKKGINKTIRVKRFGKEDYEKQEKDRVKRSIMVGVDFQKIEEAPITELEREVQKKIAVPPEALDRLIQAEEMEMLSEALEHAGLSDSEKLCIKLTLEGFKPIQIARNLGIGNSLAHYYLSTAKRKISTYIRAKCGSFEGEV